MQEIPVRSFSVSLIILRLSDNRHELLLLKRSRTLAGTWCQVAGATEPGEAAWQTAKREAREETGLTLHKLYSADICEQFYEADRDAITLVPVFVGYAGPNAQVVLNAEHHDFRWVSFEEAAELVPFSGQRRVLDHVKREFVDRTPNPWLLIEEAVE
jgi:dATP pyrophosphohydrolase